MAANNGDGVRMMLSVEALSVKVSVDLRKRTPHSPRHIARQGSNEHRDNVQGSFVLATKPTYTSHRVTGDPYPGVRYKKRLRTAASVKVSDSLRLSIGMNNVRTKTCCREMKPRV